MSEGSFDPFCDEIAATGASRGTGVESDPSPDDVLFAVPTAVPSASSDDDWAPVKVSFVEPGELTDPSTRATEVSEGLDQLDLSTRYQNPIPEGDAAPEAGLRALDRPDQIVPAQPARRSPLPKATDAPLREAPVVLPRRTVSTWLPLLVLLAGLGVGAFVAMNDSWILGGISTALSVVGSMFLRLFLEN